MPRITAFAQRNAPVRLTPHDLVPVGLVEEDEQAVAGDARVVDRGCPPARARSATRAKNACDLARTRRHRIAPPDAERPAPRARRRPLRPPHRCRPIADRDGRALPAELQSDGAADAARSSGDDGGASREPAVCGHALTTSEKLAPPLAKLLTSATGRPASGRSAVSVPTRPPGTRDRRTSNPTVGGIMRRSQRQHRRDDAGRRRSRRTRRARP